MFSSNMWSEFQRSLHSWLSALFLLQVAKNMAFRSRSMNIFHICFSRSSLQLHCSCRHAPTLLSLELYRFTSSKSDLLIFSAQVIDLLLFDFLLSMSSDIHVKVIYTNLSMLPRGGHSVLGSVSVRFFGFWKKFGS